MGCHSLHYCDCLVYATAASRTAGAVAEQAADRKYMKDAELSAVYEFQPVAYEWHGMLSEATVSLLADRKFSRKFTENFGEKLEDQFLFQIICLLIQRFNSKLL